MKIQNRIQEQNWRLLYYQYQNSPSLIVGTFIAILVVSFLLLIFVIKPQFQNFLSIQGEAARTRTLIKNITNNTQAVSTLSDETVDREFQTAITALPGDRDFSSIINAIFAAATRAGVVVGDYTFSIGGGPTATAQANTHDALHISLTINGTLPDVKQFIQEMTTKIPIADVVSVGGQGNNVSVDVQFSFKSFPGIVYNDTEPLQLPETKYKTLIATLSDWQTQSVGISDGDITASASAIPDSPF